MASNKNFKATKQRSHSSPELQITSTSAESSSDENVQKILSELVEYKDKVENSAQSLGLPERSQTVLRPRVKHGNERQNFANDGAGETVLDSTVSGTGTASEIRNGVFFKGFKFLSHLRGRNCLKDSGKKGSVSEDLDGDMQASFGPRQQRSKSVCGTLLNKLKCKGQKQSNHLSSSDDSDHDVLKSHAHCLDKFSKRKHKRHKVKSTSSVSSGVSKAKSLKHADLENDYCDNVQHAEDNKRTVEDGSSCRTASSAVENDSEIVSIPSFYRVPAALANDQAQLAPQHQASSIPASQPFPHVVTTTQNIYAHYDALSENGTFSHRTVHTQIDYMHCLIPDQWSIINSPYYWGQINRFEADNLLINKEEGTFILRDSTQEEFVFSVSFRRYGRTLHARIEQWNHKFTFDAHDPGVHSSQTICGLLEHYKNPNFCMFFEPMLTAPLLKKNPQSLQELCRARICTHISYNGISSLNLPIVLREYLRVYHYKQRLRVRKMEVDRRSVEDNQPGVITNTCLSSVHSIIL